MTEGALLRHIPIPAENIQRIGTKISQRTAASSAWRSTSAFGSSTAQFVVSEGKLIWMLDEIAGSSVLPREDGVQGCRHK
jgi:hypothetical protein